MPRYDFECPTCGLREERDLRINDRNTIHIWCRRCSDRMNLVPSRPASINPGADHWRTRIKSHGEGM